MDSSNSRKSSVINDKIAEMIATADEIVWGEETRHVDPVLLDKAISYYIRTAEAA